jgi:hypothetical protein
MIALARGKQLESIPELIKGLSAFSAGAIARKTVLDGVQKVLIAERLRQELDGARLHRLHGHRNIAVRRDEDDRELPIGRTNLALELDAASSRHSHVDDQADRALGQLSLEEIGNG